MLGNIYTGDLTALRDLATGDIRMDGNWVTFELAETNLTVRMIVFAEDSTYGIGNGRISRLAIFDDAKRHRPGNFFEACETLYDQGWNIKPRTTEAFERCRQIVEAMGARLNIRRPREPSIAPSL